VLPLLTKRHQQANRLVLRVRKGGNTPPPGGATGGGYYDWPRVFSNGTMVLRIRPIVFFL